MLLASLKDLISSGELRLDPMLAAIASAARRLTGASGSAIAMWREGVMVCRARSGETAPALGAELNAETGISGECLRTGEVQHCPDTEKNPLVNVEVCRALGLRSMVVLPIRGWHGINGILEVFGTEPAAFSERQIALLGQLAALAERARSSHPRGASQIVAKAPEEKPRPSGMLRASDRVRVVVLAVVGRRSGRFVLGAIGVAAIVLVSRVTTTRMDMGMGYELDVIAAVVLGGASIFGGSGTIWGTAIGLAMIQLLKNGLALTGVKGDATIVVIGVALILSVLIASSLQRRRD